MVPQRRSPEAPIIVVRERARAPPASARWQALEQRVATVLAAYGYQQIRLPIVESTAVFERSIGDTTDIVQ